MKLQKQTVVQGDIPLSTTSTNHHWIYDRSGSMSWVLRKLVEDMIVHSNLLQEGDVLSVSWFSTEGKFATPIKNMLITSGALDKIATYLRNNATTIGLTCFSEVLVESKNIFTEMSQLNPNAEEALIFFTDGHPVVRDPRGEMQRTLAALQQLEPDRALFVGYGDYYNRGFMSQMAEACNGMLVHADDLAEFHTAAQTFVESARTSYIEYYLGVDTSEAFYITGGLVQPLFVAEQHVHAPIGAEVYYTTAGADDEPDETGLYALALLRLQQMKVDEAIQILGELGDVYLIDALTNAFTNADYGRAEAQLRMALTDPKHGRYLFGKQANYVPKPDALCVLEVLERITADEEAKFYPQHPAFKYKRIGSKHNTLPGYPAFGQTDAAVPFTDMVWNKTRANLNVRAATKGIVELINGDAEAVGLNRYFESVKFNNYTIVKDGNLHTTDIPMTCSPDTYQWLYQEGLAPMQWDGETPFVLDLTGIPVINQEMARAYVEDIDYLVGLKERELEWEAAQKVNSYYMKLYNPEGVKLGVDFTPAQQEVLALNGISAKGVYSPPVEPSAVTDSYMAKEFIMYKDGQKSLPDVKTVAEKIKNEKTLTAREELVAPYIEEVLKADAVTMGLVRALETDQASIRDELRDLRKGIQRTLFAVIVGKQWFEDLDSFEDAKYDGWVFTLKETEVKF